MNIFRFRIIIRRFSLLAIFILIAGLMQISAGRLEQKSSDWEFPESCTSIMVGRLASVDGSVMTAHACDGNYRTWVNIVPHQKHAAGTTAKIHHGFLHTETPWDMRNVTVAGEIPQVEETYAYLNTAYPCLNEKQLGIGETTIGGRKELYNSEGLFLIENLQSIVLERCTTAREAIRLIGQLVKEYGYCDHGECLTFADPKEVWHFEIFGAGPLEIGAVWAAVRIPDDHVGVSANIPRIGELDLDNADYFMASDNVFSVAEEMEWWDPASAEPFKFWKAYSGRTPFSTREFFVLSTMAPSLGLNPDAEELPFSVKPDKKVSVRDVLAYYRQTYEGTDLDMTKNLLVKDRQNMVKSPVAHPWMTRDMINLINTLKPGVIDRKRTIAIAPCSYSEVLQLRDWLPDPIGGIAWFSFDNPGESPRIPIFSGVTELPPDFERCAQHRFRMDSACWAFRRANRLSTWKWGEARPYIEKAVQEFEDRAFTDLPDIEKKAMEIYKSEGSDSDAAKLRHYLTRYTNDFARAAVQKYLELGDQFWTMFSRGF
ncbi:MAG: C69 family dipeptidase [Candidatus Aminicenantes bacterium]|nr:C69 family dipeptidase [Candidatus Aminicenantes bacterium]